MTQLNTPYPSTAYLTGFLRSRGVDAVQEDLALALVLKLFSADGLARDARRRSMPLPAREALARSVTCFTPSSIATPPRSRRRSPSCRAATRRWRTASPAARFLPEGPRFESLDVYVDDDGGDPLAWAFGALGVQDRARHLATLYLNDLADVLRDAVDPRFEFVRYAESLAQSQPTFDPLAEALAAPPNLVDRTLRELTLAALERHAPSVVLISVPFPGAVYAAFRIAQAIKAHDPAIVTVLGGGFVNTELRELSEPRVFDHFDYVTLDAGERPLLALIEHLRGRALAAAAWCAPSCARRRLRGALRQLHRARHRLRRSRHADLGRPAAERYLSLLDMLNPMHRLWSDGRWNKLTVAHGCYWKKCSFCDVSLDYISRYDGASAATLVDRIEAIVAETGQTGLSLRRRSRAAEGAARRSPPSCSAPAGDLLVGQHPLREVLHARAVPAARRQRLHRDLRRAGSGVRPAARS